MLRLDGLCWIFGVREDIHMTAALERQFIDLAQVRRSTPQAAVCHFRCAEVLGGLANEHRVRVLSGGVSERPVPCGFHPDFHI